MRRLQGAKYVYGDNPEFAEVDLTCFVDNGLEITGVLSCGDFGCTYLVCKKVMNDADKDKNKKDECNIVAKLGDIKDEEVKMMRLAGDLGIGPKFIKYFTCPVTNPEESGKISMGVLLMEKLDKTLDASVPWDIDDIKDIEKLRDLALLSFHNRIFHGDLSTSNVMTVLKDNKKTGEPEIAAWKVIDYGFAEKIPDVDDRSRIDEKVEPIVAEWMCLFDTILDAFYEELEGTRSGDKFIKQVTRVKDDLEAQMLEESGLDGYGYSKYCDDF